MVETKRFATGELFDVETVNKSHIERKCFQILFGKDTVTDMFIFASL